MKTTSAAVTGRSRRAHGRIAPWAAWILLAVCIAALLTTFALDALAPRPFPAVEEFSSNAEAMAVAMVGFMAVGVLIVVRVPGNRLGWILCTFALLMVINPLLYQYAIAGLPGWDVAAWASSWAWLPPIALLSLAMLRFPTGQPPRSWRWVEWVAMAGVIASVGIGLALWPRRGLSLLLVGDAYPGVAGVVANVALPLSFAAFVAAAVSLLVRLRGARGVERQQLKWLVAAVAVAAAGLVVFAAGDVFFGGVQPPVADVLSTLGLLGIPSAIWIAITRYRLYELDRLISRTVTYALVTVALAAVYAVVAVVPTVLFDVQSDVLVAAATLAAAALFRPLRERVQSAVDRRFDRTRYDALRTAGAFALRLRGASDLRVVERDLTRTVRMTMQPAHVSVWLRP